MRTFKIVIKVLKWILFAIVTLLLVNNIYVIVQRANGNDMPKFLGVSSAVVVSPSMENTISVNDVIICTEKSDYKVGDIIMFKDEKSGDYVTHRIIEQVGDEFRTKGDNPVNSPDPDLVKKSSIVGAVTLVLPQFGLVSQFMSSTGGLIVCIIIILAVIFLPDIISAVWAKYVKGEKPEQATNSMVEKNGTQGGADSTEEK